MYHIYIFSTLFFYKYHIIHQMLVILFTSQSSVIIFNEAKVDDSSEQFPQYKRNINSLLL